MPEVQWLPPWMGTMLDMCPVTMVFWHLGAALRVGLGARCSLLRKLHSICGGGCAGFVLLEGDVSFKRAPTKSSAGMDEQGYPFWVSLRARLLQHAF